MKKIIALILLFAMLLSFAACGEKKPSPAPDNTTTQGAVDVATDGGIEETTGPAIDEGPKKLNPSEDWPLIKAFFQQMEHTLFNVYRYEDPEKTAVDYDGGCIGNLPLNDGSDVKPYKNEKVLENGLVFELCMTEGGDKRDSYIVVHPTESVGKVYVAFGGTQLIHNQETKKREPVEFAMNEFVFEDMESYINLAAIKENAMVVAYDIDDDGLNESIALSEDIGIYDCVNDMIVSSWVLQSISGGNSCYLCMDDPFIKEEYINCIAVDAMDEKASGIYSYNDGVLKRICSAAEATSANVNVPELSEDDLPEIESLMADANERLSTVLLGLNDIFSTEGKETVEINNGYDNCYYELPQNELFNNRAELIDYLCGAFTRSFAEKIFVQDGRSAYGIVEEADGKLYFTPVGIGTRFDVDDLKHERFVKMEQNGEVCYMQIMSYNLYDLEKLDGTEESKKDAFLRREQISYTLKYEDGWKYDEFQNIYNGLPY